MPNRDLPFVSVLTPTRNRRAFIPQLLRNYRSQSHPLDRMELVVADDGEDAVADLFKGVRGVKYLRVEPMPLGRKRNLLTAEARGEILVHMDDDDFYPRRRVEHAVERLMGSPHLLAGSSEMFIYDLFLDVVLRSGPFGPSHGTNGTLAYKREYLRENRFDDAAVIRDEQLFTRGFGNPMVQLDARATILCIQHQANTWNKNATSMQPTGLGLADFVDGKESLRFYRYQIRKRLLGQMQDSGFKVQG